MRTVIGTLLTIIFGGKRVEERQMIYSSFRILFSGIIALATFLSVPIRAENTLSPTGLLIDEGDWHLVLHDANEGPGEILLKLYKESPINKFKLYSKTGSPIWESGTISCEVSDGEERNCGKIGEFDPNSNSVVVALNFRGIVNQGNEWQNSLEFVRLDMQSGVIINRSGKMVYVRGKGRDMSAWAPMLRIHAHSINPVNGNITVVGIYAGSPTVFGQPLPRGSNRTSNSFVAVMDKNFQPISVKTYLGASRGAVSIGGVHNDRFGNTYIAGLYSGIYPELGLTEDGFEFLIRYSPQGSRLWVDFWPILDWPRLSHIEFGPDEVLYTLRSDVGACVGGTLSDGGSLDFINRIDPSDGTLTHYQLGTEMQCGGAISRDELAVLELPAIKLTADDAHKTIIRTFDLPSYSLKKSGVSKMPFRGMKYQGGSQYVVSVMPTPERHDFLGQILPVTTCSGYQQVGGPYCAQKIVGFR